jgi:hypothetical protein
VRRNLNETEPMRPVYPQSAKDDRKLWPEYGADWFCPLCLMGTCRGTCVGAQGLNSILVRVRFYGSSGKHGDDTFRSQKTVRDMVDIEQSYGLYTTPHWRAAARRDGAPAKLLTDSGDRSPTTQVGGAGFGGSPVSGRGFCTSGLFDR